MVLGLRGVGTERGGYWSGAAMMGTEWDKSCKFVNPSEGHSATRMWLILSGKLRAAACVVEIVPARQVRA